MRGRLFWKILVGFWLTFMLILQGVWVLFSLHENPGVAVERRHRLDIARARLDASATALACRGEQGLASLIAGWPEADRDKLTVLPKEEAGPDLLAEMAAGAQAAESAGLAGRAGQAGQAGQAGPPETGGADQAAEPVRAVREATGRVLVYDLSQPYDDRRPRGVLKAPPEVLFAGAIGGLMFSTLLAWYLARPVRWLKSGFERLAKGDLGVRLGFQTGWRRDEISDLARDFDAMAERLEQLVNTRERLLHDVSHELRSPLARLQLAIGLARQSPDRVEQTLTRIEAEAAKLDELVGELLSLARVEAGAQQLDGYFDLFRLVRTVAEDAAFEAQASGARVITQAEAWAEEGARLPVVKGDAELLRRALENVIRNALRHSARGQAVYVTVAPDRDRYSYVITIADQGPGVDPGALARMFEPFVRLGSSAPEPRTGSQGLGLGLAIARRAVEAHGGQISAVNGQTRGLVVTIRLPFGPASEPDAATPALA